MFENIMQKEFKGFDAKLGLLVIVATVLDIITTKVGMDIGMIELMSASAALMSQGFMNWAEFRFAQAIITVGLILLLVGISNRVRYGEYLQWGLRIVLMMMIIFSCLLALNNAGHIFHISMGDLDKLTYIASAKQCIDLGGHYSHTTGGVIRQGGEVYGETCSIDTFYDGYTYLNPRGGDCGYNQTSFMIGNADATKTVTEYPCPCGVTLDRAIPGTIQWEHNVTIPC
jgi:hypothetical protein